MITTVFQWKESSFEADISLVFVVEKTLTNNSFNLSLWHFSFIAGKQLESWSHVCRRFFFHLFFLTAWRARDLGQTKTVDELGVFPLKLKIKLLASQLM